MLDWLFPPRRHGWTVRERIGRAAVTPISRLVEDARQRVEGIVEVEDGAVETAPLSRRACVYWMVVVEEVGIEPVDRGIADDGVPFLVRASDGVARVVPGAAHVDLPARDRRTYPPIGAYRPKHQLPGTERALFEQLAIRLKYPQTSSIRFTELLVEPGARVSALGNVQLEPVRAPAMDEPGGYRAAVPTRPVLGGARRRPLLLVAA